MRLASIGTRVKDNMSEKEAMNRMQYSEKEGKPGLISVLKKAHRSQIVLNDSKNIKREEREKE